MTGRDTAPTDKGQGGTLQGLAPSSLVEGTRQGYPTASIVEQISASIGRWSR